MIFSITMSEHARPVPPSACLVSAEGVILSTADSPVPSDVLVKRITRCAGPSCSVWLVTVSAMTLPLDVGQYLRIAVLLHAKSADLIQTRHPVPDAKHPSAIGGGGGQPCPAHITRGSRRRRGGYRSGVRARTCHLDR